jgi:restriction endonuclease Mrr
MLPLLRFLGSRGEQPAAAVIDGVADSLGLSREERAGLTPSGNQPIIANRIHWAMTYMSQAGLTDRPRKGIWRVTDEGRRVLASAPERLDLEFLKGYDSFREFLARQGAESNGEDTEALEERADAGGMPLIDDLLDPFLRVISDEQAHLLPKVVDQISHRLRLSPADRERRIPTGKTVIEHRVGWARTSLVRAGLVEQPKASVVRLTPIGNAFVLQHPGRIDTETLKRECPSFATWLADMGEIPVDERSDRIDPTVWMIRAGERGIYAGAFIDESAAMLGWGAVGDISGLSIETIAQRVARAWPEYKRVQKGQAANALFRFSSDMRPGDLVVTPEPANRTLILGEVTGKYEYRDEPAVADYRHTRPVRWFARIERSELSYGARNSLSTQISLSRPAHEEELLRLASVHKGDPAPQRLSGASTIAVTPAAPEYVVIPTNAAPPERSGLPKADPVSRELVQLLSQLNIGQLALPNFQRTFVWAPDETRELIVSMIRTFPAGALLLLQDGSDSFKAREVEGAPPLSVRPAYLVLDGQQRLTSLYQAVYGVGDHRFFLDVGALLAGAEVDSAVKVMPLEKARAFESIESQARSLLMPLTEIRDNRASRWRDQVVSVRDDDDKERVRDLLREVEYACIDPLVRYAFPVTILPPGTLLEAVCTIFETLNRTGRPLTPFELISARAFAGGHSLHDLWMDAVDQYPILNDYEIEPYYLLQTIALRLGASCKRTSILRLAADDIATEWSSAVGCMAAALEMLRNECGVLTAKWLPYQPMLIPLAAVWREVEGATGATAGAMRTKLKRWFWCACFTGEYESSSATLAERDAPVLRAWLHGEVEPPVVVSFQWDPERWSDVTVRQQGLYRSTMALALINHPKDFHSTSPLTRELIVKNRIDDHHIFPRAYLRSIGKGDAIDSVLNHCLIDHETNVLIGKKPPSQYLAEIHGHLGSVLDEILASHYLPTDQDGPLYHDDLEAFLGWRMERLASLLMSFTGGLFGKHVAGQRSAMDAQIEAIELALRRLVKDRLDEQADVVPSHVRDKALERIEAARRKNPGLGVVGVSLDGLLEYCDLRDIQDVLTSKMLWPRFEQLFGTKEMLALRLGQLADLRNGIRHSRLLDVVARKDGEAALLWFQAVLRTV